MSVDDAPVVPAGSVFAMASFVFGLVAGEALPSGRFELAVGAASAGVLTFAAVRLAARSWRAAGGDEPTSASLESRFERHVSSRPGGPHRRRGRRRVSS